VHCNATATTQCNTLLRHILQYTVLQHTAIHCTATHCSTHAQPIFVRCHMCERELSALQHCNDTATHYAATCCNTTHCNTLQHTCPANLCAVSYVFGPIRCAATHYNILQHTALQHTALQRTATHCNTLQHTALQYTATHMPSQSLCGV